MKRAKIIRDLEAGKECVISEGRVYFLSINNYPISLEEKYYFKRKEELSKFFSDRNEKEQKRLVLENLSILGIALPLKDYPIPKITVYRHSCWATTLKIENYAEDDPQWGDDKDIIFKKSLQDSRGNVLSDAEESSWSSERNNWVFELAKKIKREIFGE